ncbi:hypothetical protein H8959_008556 [Pygathrix nigripes]
MMLLKEAATAAAGGEEEKEASPAEANEALRFSAKKVPAPMSPRRAPPTIPRRAVGTGPSAYDRCRFALGSRMW